MIRGLLLYLAILLPLAGQSTAPKSKVLLRPKVPGGIFLAMKAAVLEFQSKVNNCQIENYDISVIEEGDNIAVLFENKNKPDNPFEVVTKGPLPEFEVLLTRKNTIIRSNFSR